MAVLDSFGNPLSLVGGVIGSVLSNYSADMRNKLNKNWAEQQATTAYNRQVELMNMQNEYNSPVKQMQRMVDAGLNPYLAQGGMQNSLPAPSVSTPPSSPQQSGVFGNPVLESLQADLLSAQVKKAYSDTNLSFAQAEEIFGNTSRSKAEIARINAETSSLSQQINMNKYKESLALMKNSSFTNSLYFFSDNPLSSDEMNNRHLISQGRNEEGKYVYVRDSYLELEELLYDTIVQEFHADNSEARYAARSYLSKIGILEAQREHLELSNKDLSAWVDIASSYYNNLNSESAALAGLAEDDYQFAHKFGSRLKIATITGAARDVLNFVGSFIPSPAKVISHKHSYNFDYGN